MTNILTAEEKKKIVEQHLKSLYFSEYGLTLSIAEANAPQQKNQANIDSLQSQMQDVIAQKNVLLAEIEILEAEIASEAPQE